MPSLAITQPYATRPLDLIDATDRSYRQIESAWASALQIQKAIRDLTNIDPETGLATAGGYFMPSSISASNRSMYEMYIDFLMGNKEIRLEGAGLLTAFTPTVSPAWPVNGLVDLYAAMTYKSATYDDTDSTTYAISEIASNTADAVVLTASVFLDSDRIYLIPKNVPVTTILASIMSLS